MPDLNWNPNAPGSSTNLPHQTFRLDIKPRWRVEGKHGRRHQRHCRQCGRASRRQDKVCRVVTKVVRSKPDRRNRRPHLKKSQVSGVLIGRPKVLQRHKRVDFKRPQARTRPAGTPKIIRPQNQINPAAVLSMRPLCDPAGNLSRFWMATEHGFVLKQDFPDRSGPDVFADAKRGPKPCQTGTPNETGRFRERSGH